MSLLKGRARVDYPNKSFHYHLKWTPDRKIQIGKGSGGFSTVFILHGPSEPNLPEQPITKQEFYALLSDLAGRGFMDNLLDFPPPTLLP
jgi:hypothetical protein